MNFLKLHFFKLLKIVTNFLVKNKLHKLLPFKRVFYDLFFRILWPYGTIIEIQGSKMYVDIYNKNKGLRAFPSVAE